MTSERKLQLYNSTALILLIIFFGSLTNSIFVNQLGYYGALFCLLAVWYETKENPFSKNGLELALILYLAVEFISFLLSHDKGAAFHNMLKRAFLMPIIYVVSTLLTKENLKKYLITIAAFAMVGVIIYLFISYRFFMGGEYQRAESGPSVFQYPITAAEIMTFFMLFFLAAAVQGGKLGYKRIVLFVLFFLAGLAVLATYKKTGWMGSAAGIAVIVFMQRKKLLTILYLSVLLLLFLQAKNSSRLFSFTIGKDKAVPTASTAAGIDTKGFALDLQRTKEFVAIADYTAGVSLYDTKLNLLQNIATPAPAGRVQFVNDTGLAVQLINTKIVLYQKQNSGFSSTGLEYISPGYTVDWILHDNILYVLDSDSGLSIFPKLFLPNEVTRYSYLYGFESIDINDKYLTLYSAKKGYEIFASNDQLLEQPLMQRRFSGAAPKFVRFADKKFFLIYDDSVAVYKVKDNRMYLQKNIMLSVPPQQVSIDSSVLVLFGQGGRWFRINLKDMAINEIMLPPEFKKVFSFTEMNGANIDAVITHRSPLLRILDIYHPSNYSRLAFWRAGFMMFKDHPLFGVGDIDLANLYKKYKRPEDKEIQGHLHNNFFHILATLGGLGLCAFIFLLYKLHQLYFMAYKTVTNNAFYKAIVAGAIASLTSFIISGLTEWNFGDHEIITIVWLTTGIVLAVKKIEEDNNAAAE